MSHKNEPQNLSSLKGHFTDRFISQSLTLCNTASKQSNLLNSVASLFWRLIRLKTPGVLWAAVARSGILLVMSMFIVPMNTQRWKLNGGWPWVRTEEKLYITFFLISRRKVLTSTFLGYYFFTTWSVVLTPGYTLESSGDI